MEPSTGPAPTGEPINQATGHPTGKPIGRRRFLEVLLGFSVVSTLAIVATPILGFLVPPKTQGAGAGGRQLAGTTDDLPIGQGTVVAMGNKPVIVVNTDQGVKAFSAICTHLGCIVMYDATLGHIVCPCHDGHFNAQTGQVLSGPPPAPLPPVTVAVEGTDIYLVSS
jgi:Rieske Fe-S protein